LLHDASRSMLAPGTRDDGCADLAMAKCSVGSAFTCTADRPAGVGEGDADSERQQHFSTDGSSEEDERGFERRRPEETEHHRGRQPGSGCTSGASQLPGRGHRST
jgi:hypothetical protein